MGPIICPQFSNYIFDVKINGRFGNRQFICNLLIATAILDEAKDFKLSIRKIFAAQMHRKTCGHLGWNMAPAGMNGTNDGEQFVLRHALEDVPESACPQCPADFRISVGSRQDDYASIGKLSPD